MAELFLIAHKVRGEPAFDIADRADDMGTASDPGPWWIIPTSGHRAYPYWYQHLNQLGAVKDDVPDLPLDHVVPPMPDPWPDHYEVHAAPKGQGKVSGLFKLLFKSEPIKRRI